MWERSGLVSELESQDIHRESTDSLIICSLEHLKLMFAVLNNYGIS